MQVETLNGQYDWEGEDEKYGEIDTPLNRASDDSDSGLEDRPTRRAYLSKKLRLRAMTEELDESAMGLDLPRSKTGHYRIRGQEASRLQSGGFRQRVPTLQIRQKPQSHSSRREGELLLIISFQYITLLTFL